MSKSTRLVLAFLVILALLVYFVVWTPFETKNTNPSAEAPSPPPVEISKVNITESSLAAASNPAFVQKEGTDKREKIVVESDNFEENTIYGRVINEQDEPLAKWSVRYLVEQTRINIVFTDIKGEFVIKDCKAVPFVLQIMEPRVKTNRTAAEVARDRPAKERIIIKIRDADRALASIIGTVYTFDGLPARDAKVDIFDSPSMSFGAKVEQDGEFAGRFVANGLKATKHRVRISEPKHARFESDWRELASKETWDLGTITLMRGGEIVAKVVATNEGLSRTPMVQLIQINQKTNRLDPSTKRVFTLTGSVLSSGPIDGGEYYVWANTMNPLAVSPWEKVLLKDGEQANVNLQMTPGVTATIEFGLTKSNYLLFVDTTLVLYNAAGVPAYVHHNSRPAGSIDRLGCVLAPGIYRYELTSNLKLVTSGDFQVNDNGETATLKITP
ncbi:MAG: hypothetical protein ACKVS6_15090 [Planctomycetota bacterium]